jgi:hypothetical protein
VIFFLKSLKIKFYIWRSPALPLGDFLSCPNKAGKTPNLASQVSNISFTDWVILSSVPVFWVHTSSVSSEIFGVAPLLVVRKEKKEVFHIRKKKKKDKYFDLPIRGDTCVGHPACFCLYLC